jgi:hypothetical protein
MLLGLIGIGLVVVATRSSRAPSLATAHVGRTANVPTAASSPFRTSAFAIGDEQTYDVSLVQTARTAGAADFIVELAGAWAVAYAGTDERGLVFRAQLRDAKPRIRRGDIDASSAFAGSLAQPYFFSTTADGRLIAMHFAREVDTTTRSALTALASSFQVSRRRLPSWETVESDSLGDYQARYTQQERGVRRERLRYQRVVGGGAIQAAVVETGTNIVLRADGWPAEVAGSEATRVGTKEIGVDVSATFSLKHRASARVTPGWYDGFEVAAVDAAASTHTQAEADRDLVDGASLVDLLAALDAVGDDSHARGYQFLRIAALLRLDPDAVRAAQRAVMDNAPTAQVLVAALGEAGTPEAQRVLHEVMSAKLPEESRAHAAVSLGLVESPTRATVDALASIASAKDEVGATATLAQGNVAMRMRDDDPAAADRQIEDLLARLARATDDEERALVLRALGNTGDARIMPALERAIATGSVPVRVAATEALRLVPAADVLLVARLADTSSIVRSAAVFAAGQRDLAPYVTAFATVIRRDVDPEVRRSLVELAAARIDEHPALRGIVEYAAEHDGDSELRQTARKLLSMPS